MDLHGFLDTEKVQCVLCSKAGHGCTTIQYGLRNKYRKSAPAHSNIWRGYQENEKRDNPAHMGENGCPQISKENNDRIRKMFSEDTTSSFGNAALEIGFLHKTIQRFLRGELKLLGKNYKWINKSMARTKLGGLVSQTIFL